MFGYNNTCCMNDLVGCKINQVAISSDEQILVVWHNQGKSVYVTYGDCCSETWIADIVGVSALIGHTVLSVEDVQVEEVDDGRGRQDVDQFFGIKITTTGGYCDLVYRNSSNGYYGGDLSRGDETLLTKDVKLITLTDDFSA